MQTVFLEVLNMSFTASWVILILAVLRPILAKGPRWIACLLWAVPVFRLLCPVTFESVLSLMPVKSQPIPQNIAMQAEPAIDSGSAAIDDVVNGVLSAPAFTPNPGDSANPLQIYQFIGTWVWIAGMVLLASWSLFSLWKLYRQLLEAVPADRNVYWCRGLETAFVVGLVNPKIYLPAGLGPEEGAYILRHEEIHVRRMDHWMKAAGFLAVCVHWFNPLVWLMFHFICTDMEMACDEAVLSEMGDNKELKKAYSTSLLNLAAGRRILSITPLAFGEGEVKNRVKNVLNFRRPKRLAVTVTLIACILLGGGLLANRADNRVQIGYLDSLDDLGPSRIKGSIEYWYEQCRLEPGVIHTYPLEDDYVGPRDDGYLVYYHHGTDHYSYFTLEARAKGDGLQFEVVEHDAVSEEYMKSELFAIVTFKEGEFPLDDVAEVDEIPAVDVSAVIDAFPDEVVGEAAKYVQQQAQLYNERGKENGYRIEGARVALLEQITTGTAAENSGINMYCLEYQLFTNHPTHTQLDSSDVLDPDKVMEWNRLGRPHLLMHYGYRWGTEVWSPVGWTDAYTITTVYGTPEMLAEYGNAYTAAAMELWKRWSSEQGEVLPENMKLEGTEIYRADVDGDGEKEVLSVAEIDHYLFTLTVSEPDGKILWQGEAGTPHVGWNTYMLYTDGKKELLVHYSPYSSTGMSAYQLQVFQLNGQEEVTLYEDETLFTVGMGEESPENTPIFLKNANALMDKCTILLSTQNGEAVIGPASPEKLQKDNEKLLAEIMAER